MRQAQKQLGAGAQTKKLSDIEDVHLPGVELEGGTAWVA